MTFETGKPAPMLTDLERELLEALERMKNLALQYAPIAAHGDGSAFAQANAAIAKARGQS